MIAIRRQLGLLALIISSTVFAADKPLENIPLNWKPTTAMGSLSAIDLTNTENVKLEFAKINDARTGNKELIGENREKPQIMPVTTKDDVPAFVQKNMLELIEKSGLGVVKEGGAHIINAELKSFFVTETDTYKGEVTMKVTLKNKAGKTLWTGLVSGSSTRFGRSYKADNYYETLSDALVEATHNLIASPAFHAAITKS